MTAHWPIIAKNLKKSLDSGVFKVWIAPLHGVVEGATLRLTAPSAYAADWVRQRLSTDLREAAAPVCNCPPESVMLDIIAAAPPASTPLPPASPASPVQSPPAMQHTIQQAQHLQQGHLPIAPAPLPIFRWRYCFDDFVTGASNAVATAAAQDICRPTSPVGTLFVSASSGLGKTHLIHAIGQSLVAQQGQARVAYLTAEDFTSRFIQAMRTHQMDAFKASLRHVDVLLLEDVHFLQGKEKTQDEALITIKCLQARGSRVVLTSTFTPRELQHMDSQLVSYFSSGLLTQMDKPTVRMRRDILTHKARQYSVFLPAPVADLLAERLDNDVRQLESCLNNLIFKARHLNRPLCVELALEVLGQYATASPHCDAAQIVRLVCESYGLTLREISSRNRKHECVLARNTAYYLTRKHTDLSLQEIGSQFNRRHSTVIKGITAVEREMQRASVVGRQLASTVALIERNAGVA